MSWWWWLKLCWRKLQCHNYCCENYHRKISGARQIRLLWSWGNPKGGYLRCHEGKDDTNDGNNGARVVISVISKVALSPNLIICVMIIMVMMMRRRPACSPLVNTLFPRRAALSPRSMEWFCRPGNRLLLTQGRMRWSSPLAHQDHHHLRHHHQHHHPNHQRPHKANHQHQHHHHIATQYLYWFSLLHNLTKGGACSSTAAKCS